MDSASQALNGVKQREDTVMKNATRIVVAISLLLVHKVLTSTLVEVFKKTFKKKALILGDRFFHLKFNLQDRQRE